MGGKLSADKQEKNKSQPDGSVSTSRDPTRLGHHFPVAGQSSVRQNLHYLPQRAPDYRFTDAYIENILRDQFGQLNLREVPIRHTTPPPRTVATQLKRPTKAPKPVKRKNDFELLFLLNTNDQFLTKNLVRYTPLHMFDAEYQEINRMITNKQNFKVDSIEKIENQFLTRAYELKKEEKMREFGLSFIQERLLFHGTRSCNVDSICKFNFNWRLHGRNKGHKFGKGVSFSPNSTYASNYADLTYDKVMIVAKVLVGRSCIGNEFTILPPPGFDTTQKGDEGIVIVKYEDSEFYPAFKINYHLMHPNRPARGRRPRMFL